MTKTYNSGLRWVANDVVNPTTKTVYPADGETPEQAVRAHLQWRKQFVVGDPMPSKYLSVKELKELNIVGLYTKDLSKFY